MLALGVGWYAVVAVAEPSFLWYTVVDNHVLNVARMRVFPDEDVPLSALEFLAAAGFGAFPWIRRGRGGGGRARAPPRVARSRRGAVGRARVWAVGVLGLFTLSPFKLPHYGLPAYPAVALLAARAWREAAPAPARADRGAPGPVPRPRGGARVGRDRATGGPSPAAVFGITDVYSRKEAALGQASPYPPWSDIQPLLVRASILLLTGAARPRAGGGAPLRARRRRGGRRGHAPAGPAGRRRRRRDLLGARGGRYGAARSVPASAPGDVLVLEGPIENAGAVEFYSGPSARAARRPPQRARHRRDLRGRGRHLLESRALHRGLGRGEAALPADHPRPRAEHRGPAAARQRAPARRRRTGDGSTATPPPPADADPAHHPLLLPGRLPDPARHRPRRADPGGAADRGRGHDGALGGDALVGRAALLPGRGAGRRHAALHPRPALRPAHPQVADRAAHPHPGAREAR